MAKAEIFTLEAEEPLWLLIMIAGHYINYNQRILGLWRGNSLVDDPITIHYSRALQYTNFSDITIFLGYHHEFFNAMIL